LRHISRDLIPGPLKRRGYGSSFNFLKPEMESEKENGCYMWPDKQNPEPFRSLESNTEILVTLKREE
jgi:hypothetical protein